MHTSITNKTLQIMHTSITNKTLQIMHTSITNKTLPFSSNRQRSGIVSFFENKGPRGRPMSGDFNSTSPSSSDSKTPASPWDSGSERRARFEPGFHWWKLSSVYPAIKTGSLEPCWCSPPPVEKALWSKVRKLSSKVCLAIKREILFECFRWCGSITNLRAGLVIPLLLRDTLRSRWSDNIEEPG